MNFLNVETIDNESDSDSELDNVQKLKKIKQQMDAETVASNQSSNWSDLSEDDARKENGSYKNIVLFPLSIFTHQVILQKEYESFFWTSAESWTNSWTVSLFASWMCRANLARSRFGFSDWLICVRKKSFRKVKSGTVRLGALTVGMSLV